MLNTLGAIDRDLLLKFQTFTHWVQRNLGWKSSDLAYAAMSVGIVSAIYHKDWFLVFCGLFELLDIHRKQQRKSTRVLDWNPFLAFVRMLGVWASVTLLYYWVTLGRFYILGATLSWYFRDCVDLPEDKSKVRIWFESLLKSHQVAHNMNG